MKNEDLLPC